ncbi:MAG TPA: transcription elongation factor GreA [Gaiellaceae bacterium]|nr:transcription elongation factor GreA [Gaiellaceae bacterium]
MIGSTSTRNDELLVTEAGHARLRAELDALTGEGRRELAERVRAARADGHLADNPELFEALEEQTLLEWRIALLETQLAGARIADGRSTDGAASIGARVRLLELGSGETFEYDLVGAIEADPVAGRISVDSPVGRALDGHAAGEVVAVETPRGLVQLELLAVAPAGAGVESLRDAA